MKKNIHTGAELEDWPNQVGSTVNATPEQAQAIGWRDMPPEPYLAAGCVRVSKTFGEGDGVTGAWEVVDRLQTELDAEWAHARSMAFQSLIPQAHLFRLLLRRNFGDGSETNRELTAEKVTEYFAGLTVAGTITALQASDGVLLARMFEDLAAWNGTGETWTLPWEVVP